MARYSNEEKISTLGMIKQGIRKYDTLVISLIITAAIIAVLSKTP
jgi:hypothetical protein